MILAKEHHQTFIFGAIFQDYRLVRLLHTNPNAIELGIDLFFAPSEQQHNEPYHNQHISQSQLFYSACSGKFRLPTYPGFLNVTEQ